MVSIGLGSAKAAAQSSAALSNAKTKKRKAVGKKKRRAEGHDAPALAIAAALPRRRSKRLRKKPPQLGGGDQGGASEDPAPDEPAEEQLPFDDSLVATYDASSARSDQVDAAEGQDRDEGNGGDVAPPLPSVLAVKARQEEELQQQAEAAARRVAPEKATTTAAANANANAAATTSTTLGPRRSLVRLREDTDPFSDDALKKIYTLAFSPGDASLLAAAGHQGRCSIFAAAGDNPGDVLMSFKAHSGWVASAHFVGPRLLLTAANDAVVTLWDLTKELSVGRNARPRIVHECKTLHSNGIFCADVLLGHGGGGGGGGSNNLGHSGNGHRLATASKDKTVAFCEIGRETGIKQIRSLGGLHSGVIKSVSLRDQHVLASTGNDTDVCVCDVRVPKGAGLVARIEDTHSFAVNHVSWNPSRGHELMTASFGNKIKLWDLRRVAKKTTAAKAAAGEEEDGGGGKACAPIRVLQGHAMLFDGQRGGIYHPLYVGRGEFVATPGAKTDAVSLFDAGSGALVSKGSTSIGEVSTLASCDLAGTRLAASRGGKVVLLDSCWRVE
jgi:WD40 repeat protein